MLEGILLGFHEPENAKKEQFVRGRRYKKRKKSVQSTYLAGLEATFNHDLLGFFSVEISADC